MIQHFKNHSIKCEPHHQNFLGMNAPTLELERLIKKEEITFERNPLLSWQASNAVLDHDSSGNVKVVKDHRQKKVDAIICLIMAIGTASKGKTIDGEVRIRV